MSSCAVGVSGDIIYRACSIRYSDTCNVIDQCAAVLARTEGVRGRIAT